VVVFLSSVDRRKELKVEEEESPGQRGKHPDLDQHREQQILDWIQQNGEKNTSVSKKEIKDYCTSQFKASITRGWVNSFILHHPDEIIQTKIVRQEQHRLQVSQVFLVPTVQNLNEHDQGCVAKLVFNRDEIGISD
jgi:hypothetical protein